MKERKNERKKERKKERKEERKKGRTHEIKRMCDTGSEPGAVRVLINEQIHEEKE
jgi:hypothetical protein